MTEMTIHNMVIHFTIIWFRCWTAPTEGKGWRGREREKERDRDRERERQTDRQREKRKCASE